MLLNPNRQNQGFGTGDFPDVRPDCKEALADYSTVDRLREDDIRRAGQKPLFGNLVRVVSDYRDAVPVRRIRDDLHRDLRKIGIGLAGKNVFSTVLGEEERNNPGSRADLENRLAAEVDCSDRALDRYA